MGFHNRVKVATPTTGTGTLSLGVPAAGFRSFSAGGVVTGEMVSYVIEQGLQDWEYGVGIYDSTANTLTRTLKESSTGSLIQLDGTASVFLTVAARDLSKPYDSQPKTNGDVTAPVGNNFINFDTATDLFIEGQPMDLIKVTINAQAGDNTTVTSIEWNFVTVVNGVEISQRTGNVGSGTPIGAWSMRPGDFFGLSASIGYLLKPADIAANGLVQLRLKVRTNGGGASRKVFASAGTVPFLWEAENIGPRRVG